MTSPDSLSVDEARAHMLAEIRPLPAVVQPLTASRGLVLAAPITAPLLVPPFRNSAMDGYAVRAADTDAARPRVPARLRVVGRIAAGDPPGPAIASGGAARIMTGAPIPPGADAVVPFEDTDERSVQAAAAVPPVISILRPIRPGQHVREAGEEIALGQVVLTPGQILTPARLGLLAGLGLDQVTVHPRPRVGLLSTGDELTPPGQPLHPGQIYDANGAMLEALVGEAGAVPVSLGSAADRAEAIVARLSAAGSVDLLITSGGVSAGDYDLVKDVLRQHDDVAIWQVRMKPGKPLAFGQVGGVPLIGLPGNAVAAAVSFIVFVRPVLARLAGHPDVEPPLLVAKLTARLDNRGGRRQYARARVECGADGRLVATPAADQSSAKLSVLSQANGLVVISETVAVAEAGALVPVILLERDPDQLIRLLDPTPTEPPAPAETK